MKKIYFWSPCLSKNVGTYKSTINSAISLSKYSKGNYTVKVINVCGEWDDEKELLKKNNVDVFDLGLKYYTYLPKEGFFKSRFSYMIIIILSVLPLVRFLKKKDLDFFVVHLITSLPLILFYFLNFNSKLILRISGFPKLNFFRKKLWTILSKKIFRCTCPSTELMKQLKTKKIFSPGKLFFLPDPIINIKEFISKLKFQENLNNDLPKKKFFISVGRLTKQKNFKYLINEFSKFCEINNNFDLLIFGEGEEKEKLKELINEKNMSEKIFLKGYSKNIFFFMKKAEVFILSSLWEDPGFVLIEAALCNLFIISSDCKNGPSEFLLNGKAGILFKSNKEDGLKQSLVDFVNQNSNLKNKMKLAKKNCHNYTLFRHFQLFNKLLTY